MKDLFDKIYKDKGPLGKWAEVAEGYFVFPKLEGPISNRMKFNGKEVITDLLPPERNAINLKNTLERIIQYADTIFTPFPNKKVMILKSSYDKNEA